MQFRSLILGCACFASVFATPGQAQTASDPLPTFSLDRGDVLRVYVWREGDLSGDFPVDEVGRVTLPMLGVVKVEGLQWYALRDSLLSLYSRQLRNPSVMLTPLRRVQVLGEVPKPGNYLADPTLSLAGLVALAGGATAGGDLHRVRVVRGGKTIVKSASVESILLTADVRSNDQIFVDRRAWIERNGAFVASALISTAGILVALIRR
jgi:polysaccharide export outer membrane protein